MIVVNTRMHTLYIYLPSPYLAVPALTLLLPAHYNSPIVAAKYFFLIIVRYSARATSVIIIGDCAIFLRTVSYNFVMMRIKLLLTFLSECYTESSFHCCNYDINGNSQNWYILPRIGTLASHT